MENNLRKHEVGKLGIMALVTMVSWTISIILMILTAYKSANILYKEMMRVDAKFKSTVEHFKAMFSCKQ